MWLLFGQVSQDPSRRIRQVAELLEGLPQSTEIRACVSGAVGESSTPQCRGAHLSNLDYPDTYAAPLSAASGIALFPNTKRHVYAEAVGVRSRYDVCNWTYLRQRTM